MRNTVRLAILTGAGLYASQALAEPAGLDALLPPIPKASACYVRLYDAEHLKKHPKQKVTEMIFSLRYLTFEEEEDGSTPEDANYHYWFTLGAKLRNKPEMLYATGACGSYGGIGCGVDCDGGGVTLEPRTNGELLIRLDREYTYIRMTPGCGDELEDGEMLEAGEDDKVFKLTKAPSAACEAIEAEVAKGPE